MQRLPSSWVDRLFAKMHGIYGTAFTNKYSNGQILPNGSDAGLENAKETWAEDLAGFYDMPEAIAYGLRNVDAKFPPSSREFASLCRAAPKPNTPALPAPELSEEQIEQRKEQLASSVRKRDDYDYHGWAKRIREAFLRNEDLYPIQINQASEALGEVWEVSSETHRRVCRPQSAHA